MNTPSPKAMNAFSPVASRIRDILRRSGRGKVFTSKDFLRFGRRDAVDQALSRLTQIGDIRRIGRGLYYYPRVNKRLGINAPPDADDIARALARQTGSRIVPSGAVAANRLGLTTQVPARLVYLTDGPSRDVKVFDLWFKIKRVAPKDFPKGSPTSAAVFQALRHVGQDAITDDTIMRLQRILPKQIRHRLLDDARYATGWLYEVAQKLSNTTADEAKLENVGHGSDRPIKCP